MRLVVVVVVERTCWTQAHTVALVVGVVAITVRAILVEPESAVWVMLVGMLLALLLAVVAVGLALLEAMLWELLLETVVPVALIR